MSEIQFDVNFANGVAFDVANDELPVCWNPFHLYQSESLLYADIK